MSEKDNSIDRTLMLAKVILYTFFVLGSIVAATLVYQLYAGNKRFENAETTILKEFNVAESDLYMEKGEDMGTYKVWVDEKGTHIVTTNKEGNEITDIIEATHTPTSKTP